MTQIDVLEQHAILLVLTDKTLYSYAIEALDPEESPLAQSKRGRKISHANFFKIGVFDGQHLVCCVRTTSLSATIKMFKPMDSMTNSKKKSGLAKMLAGGQEVLKPHKVLPPRDPAFRPVLLIPTTSGILYSHRNLLNSLPSLLPLRRLRPRLRNRQPRYTNDPVSPRPSRHLARLRRPQRKHPPHPRRAHQP